MGIAKADHRLVGNRYELTGEVLATGGMGRVLAARDPVLNRDVAVKILHDESTVPAALERFRHEAHVAARLAHPNAVAVYDAGEHDGRPYIVMERLPGRTLAHEIADGALDAARARQVACEVLSVLARAHELGIVHRDIKPQNVLIASDGSTKLTDFGIAKSVSWDLTATHDVLGTPAYLAPEILEGSPASTRTDVFSAGVMLYQAVTGRRPFAGETPWEVAAAARRGEFVPIRDIVPWFDAPIAAAIERALAADPLQRFPDATAMLGAFEQRDDTMVLPVDGRPDETVVLDRGERPARAGSVRRFGRPAPGRRVILIGLAAVCLLLLALLVAATNDGTPSRNPQRGPSRNPAPATGAPLPAPLDEALDELERAVSP